MSEHTSLAVGLRALPLADRTLLKAMIGVALATLALGLVFGALTAFIRAGFFEVHPETGYRLMTLHGVTVFFYWLYFAQAAVLLAFAAVYTKGAGRIAFAPAAWLGFALMLLGFAANQTGALTGAPLLYDGSPEVVGDDRFAAGVFYSGYLLLAAGLFLVSGAAIATALKAKFDGAVNVWSTISFGTVAWAGLVMVSSIAAVNAFLPATLWAFGWREMPTDHSTGWHLLFHNLHYLPLMGTVLIWYALVREATGVGSIFGDRFSKIVFSFYMIFVPPTSLYHMFLEPGLSPVVRALGSLLSLFISVPTVAVFLIIVASLEVHARARGARGLFGWISIVPWRDPSMSTIGMAVVNLAFGGTLAFVLIQEQLAKLLSDTFFVPGYFHFLTVGTVSLTLLAAFARMIPALTGWDLWSPRLLARLPYMVTIGLVVFGVAGVAAGLTGMPRRVLDAAYDGASPAVWTRLSVVIGVGAAIMAAGLAVYAYGLLRTLLAPVRERPGVGAAPIVAAVPGVDVIRQTAWAGPLSVAILVAAMYAATAIAFKIMQALPFLSTGGGGH